MAKKRLPKHKYCQKEDVNVKFPGHAGRISVQRLPMPPLASMPAVAGGFQPVRLVINLKLADTMHPNSKLLKFEPPIEFHVRYTKADLAKIGSGQLSLGFWDGTQWVRFTKASHKFRLIRWEEAKGRGLAVVSISEWGDPPVAVGK